MIRTTLVALLAAGALCVAACHSHPKSPEEQTAMQEDFRARAHETLNRLYREKPNARAAIEGATGFAVFNAIGTRLTIAGTGRGKGVAFDNRDGKVFYMRVGEISLGLGPSIKSIDLILLFKDRAAFDQFLVHGWNFQGGSVAAAKAGEFGGALEGAWEISPGVYAFQMTQSGLALEFLTIKTMRFYPDNGLN